MKWLTKIGAVAGDIDTQALMATSMQLAETTKLRTIELSEFNKNFEEKYKDRTDIKADLKKEIELLTENISKKISAHKNIRLLNDNFIVETYLPFFEKEPGFKVEYTNSEVFRQQFSRFTNDLASPFYEYIRTIEVANKTIGITLDLETQKAFYDNVIQFNTLLYFYAEIFGVFRADKYKGYAGQLSHQIRRLGSYYVNKHKRGYAKEFLYSGQEILNFYKGFGFRLRHTIVNVLKANTPSEYQKAQRLFHGQGAGISPIWKQTLNTEKLYTFSSVYEFILAPPKTHHISHYETLLNKLKQAQHNGIFNEYGLPYKYEQRFLTTFPEIEGDLNKLRIAKFERAENFMHRSSIRYLEKIEQLAKLLPEKGFGKQKFIKKDVKTILTERKAFMSHLTSWLQYLLYKNEDVAKSASMNKNLLRFLQGTDILLTSFGSEEMKEEFKSSFSSLREITAQTTDVHKNLYPAIYNVIADSYSNNGSTFPMDDRKLVDRIIGKNMLKFLVKTAPLFEALTQPNSDINENKKVKELVDQLTGKSEGKSCQVLFK